MKKYFITFSNIQNQENINDNFFEAGKRIIKQAENTKLFDKCIFYTDEVLKNEHSDFWNKHKDFILNNKKGFGLYIWKPYIIKKTMDTLLDGDVVLYLDAGCEIRGEKQKNMPELFELVKKHKIIGSLTSPENQYTSIDLIVSVNMENNIHDILTPQRQGGTNAFLVCDETRKLVDEWYNLSIDYDLISGKKKSNISITQYPQLKDLNIGMRGYRHDQSIFSLLTKKYNIFADYMHKFTYIIRNRSGKSNV